jgi:2-polyprenylphenol 6-hydroxylase
VDFDVVIVGGGLAGLAVAVALKRSRLSIAVIESEAPVRPYDWDARIYAISSSNADFLRQVGIWDELDASRIAQVRAMEIHGDAGGHLEFSAYDSGLSELAWIVESSAIRCELRETARRQGNVTMLCPARPSQLLIDTQSARLTLADGRTLSARLVVAADGADSWTRSAAGIEVAFKAYGELAVVANFACELPHRDTAFQWFRRDGVLAYLPLPGNLVSIVWSTPEQHGRELMALGANEFCQRVADAGGRRVGALSLLTAPAAFPLRLMRAPRSVDVRLALVGDAGHAIHPLSGHGINLGFQDARVLAEVLMACSDHVDCGDLIVLRRFERARKEEVVALQSATDALQGLFAKPGRPWSLLRNAGLNLTQHLPLLKDMLVRYAAGYTPTRRHS